MIPYQTGGDMVKRVTFEMTEYNDIPTKFEAGTPNISGAIGLGAAIDYIRQIGIENIAKHEQQLLAYATEAVKEIAGLEIIGTAQQKASILSFIIPGIHPHDIGTILNSMGVAIRAGHHCAMPVMDKFGVDATSRASFAMYNTKQEIDIFIDALKKVREVLI